MPGAAPRIIIRGGTSINNPNGASPLYIVDGIIRNDMNGSYLVSNHILWWKSTIALKEQIEMKSNLSKKLISDWEYNNGLWLDTYLNKANSIKQLVSEKPLVEYINQINPEIRQHIPWMLLEEKDMPYCKRMIYINDVIRILRDYQDCKGR